MFIKLVAFDIELYYAWREVFQGCDGVEVIDDHIFNHQADALVSPANSFGYMDGGLDLKISQKLGWQLEEKVRHKIIHEYAGELPVGNACIIKTESTDYPYLISAPTMRVPMNVSVTVNAFLAFRAILLAIAEFNRQQPRITSVVCPGLGTGEGKMPAQQCARQMREAYDVAINGKRIVEGGLADAVRNHQFLLMQT